jgi:hypothetical protein
MAFGQPTGLAQRVGGPFTENQRPMGLQFFMNTGIQCSNGAPMHEYISTIPTGNALGKSVQGYLQSARLPAMRGLAPGILEDVKDTLNPARFFDIAQSTAYPKCRKVRLPVGDSKGQIRSSYEPSNVWIEGKVDTVGGKPTQERWIFDKWITKEEWDAEPKTEEPPIPTQMGRAIRPELTCQSEGFQTMESSLQTSHIYATILLTALSLGFLYYKTATK